MKETREKVYIIDSGNDFRFICKENLNNMGFHVVGTVPMAEPRFWRSRPYTPTWC